MKTKINLLFIIIVSFTLFYCEKNDEGSFNIEITNPFSQDILIKSSAIVSTSIPSLGSVSLTGTAGEGSLYAVDLYCKDNCLILGEQGSAKKGNTTFNFLADEDYRWTAGQNTLQTGSNGGGDENTDCSLDNYSGPSRIDLQYDFQCQAAYAYWCTGATNALEEQCKVYRQLQAQLGLPDCQYCN